MRLSSVPFIFLLSILLSGCATPKNVPAQTLEINDFKLYHSLGGKPDKVVEMFKKDGFNRIVLINQRNLDGRKEWTFDKKALTYFVEKQIPSPKADFVVVLDWEGAVMDAIIGGRAKNPADYDRASALMIAAYQTVKSLRPETTVGYYGYPIRNYHGRNEKWRAKNESLDELFNNFDALFPSLYDFYHDDENATRKDRDVSYVTDNTTEALRMGNRIGKPVYPFIWHRYHTSNKKRGWQPIPVEEFRGHLKSMLTAEADGRRVNGMVWWGSDWSQFATRNKKKIARKELRGEWEKEASVLFPVYYNAIKEAAADFGKN